VSTAPLVAGVELGGTKAVTVIGRGAEIVERCRIATGEPGTTLDAIADQLWSWREGGHDVEAIGIASFGPVGLDPRRADYGHVTTTPKPGWAGTDVVGHLGSRFDVPVAFDNDVNAAALAEVRWGAARGCSVAVYITIGTGIGGGVVVDGRPLHGLVHPEHGHLRVRRRADDGFPGVCPYHGDCIEGLASGPAIAARAGVPAESLPAEHPVWGDVAGELGHLMALLVLSLSPQRIAIGGGVGYGQRWLLPRVRDAALGTLAGYVAALDPITIGELIVPTGLGDDAGPLGAIALALTLLDA
jgi:fructokinase